ncbi:hypothetical protein WA026_011813 [Henosepilachna vigintioctopunctata]|uniref:Uncharacterized protein n=1 Tax=Henosepilachna vigintioctopunctata TaxID=420089 RepID=A0AAW1UHA2_9CUCU
MIDIELILNFVNRCPSQNGLHTEEMGLTQMEMGSFLWPIPTEHKFKYEKFSIILEIFNNPMKIPSVPSAISIYNDHGCCSFLHDDLLKFTTECSDINPWRPLYPHRKITVNTCDITVANIHAIVHKISVAFTLKPGCYKPGSRRSQLTDNGQTYGYAKLN